MDEMMRVTTSFLRGEVAASNHERKKSFSPWKQHEGNQKQNFKKRRFSKPTKVIKEARSFFTTHKNPKEIFDLDKGKFKAPPPMTTPVEKQNHAKFCEFHGEVGHNTNECIYLRKQIDEMLKAGKLSHLIKEIKQDNVKEQPKVTKKGETSRKDKALAILMVQPWEIVARQRITQSFSPNPEIFFPPLGEDEGTKSPIIIERNLDTFAWKPADMTGVPRRIAKHRLNVREGCSPVRQKKRGQAADRNQAIQEEVENFMGAGIMREVHYHDWLSNPVMVKNMTVVGGSNSGAPYANGTKWKKELIVYLATAKETVSAVLVTKKEAKQMPIYFVSRALRGPELNYTSMEKLVPALVHASKRLKRPRVSIKGRILAEFIVERPEKDSSDTPMEEEGELPEPWILFTDESSCTDGSKAGLILTNPEGMKFTYALRSRFDATNNEAEYEALITRLRIAKQMEADMIRYLEKVKAFIGSFKSFSIKQIPRSKNKKSDALSKIASTSFAHLSKQVLVEELKEKCISEVEILMVVEEEGDTWMTPLFKYLMEGTLPAEVKKARAIKRKSWRFTVFNETLYKKSFLDPWLRCVGPLQANYILREIHDGSCSMHAGTRSVVAKALRNGYCWPTMHRDARLLIRAWKVKFLIVAMDYFTKQIEAKSVATITGNKIKKIVWDNVVCGFGLPGEIISDNGKQFRDDPFKDWCEKLCIRQHFASVKHNQWPRGKSKSQLKIRDKSKVGCKKLELYRRATSCMPTLIKTKVDLVGNNEALEINLDLLEERRKEAAIREAKSKAKMEKYYNSKVRNTSFKPGDLVYRNNDARRVEDTGKLCLSGKDHTRL
uniref:Reverse transcriptase RNase H-like domain-containing protein n=1 Tax=Tanacetum cinerariifolium TaxID=118510 RepID=A0A699GK66_TANCI|nr:hypothetical protein [Tanacetum cinerariifolium]